MSNGFIMFSIQHHLFNISPLNSSFANIFQDESDKPAYGNFIIEIMLFSSQNKCINIFYYY